MKKMIFLTLALMTSGCATTGDTQSNTSAWIIAGAVVAGALVIANANSGSDDKENCFIVVTPTGSDHVCQ